MKHLLLILGLTVATQTSYAQSDWPENFHYQKMGNGLEVLVIENDAVPLATIELAVRNGAFTEPDSTNGLAHLYEHLFFKVNKKYPTADSLLNRIDELGLVFNATTSDERSNYFINLSSENLKGGIDFLSAAVQYPIFSKDIIESEYNVIESKLQRAESNPVFFLIRDLNEKLWGEHASRKNAMGDPGVIFNATPEELQLMHDRYYVPNNSLLVISGDVEHDTVFSYCREAFKDWKASQQSPLDAYPIPQFDTLSTSKGVITINEQAQGPLIICGFQGPTTTNDIEATYAADILSYMLSQKNSALGEALVEKELAHQVGVGYTTQKYGGSLTIFLVPKQRGIQEAMDALGSNIERWDDPDFFTDEELENAKRMLMIQELYSREAPSEIVHNISYWWASADLEYFTDYPENIQNVSRADITRLVRSYIQGQPNVTALLISQQMKNMLEISSVNVLNTQQ